MKIYFTAIVDNNDQKLINSVEQIFSILKTDHQVVANYAAINDANETLDYYLGRHRKIKTSEIYVAEISYAKDILKYEIALVFELNKQIILLFSGREPPIIAKLPFHDTNLDNIQVIKYTKENLKQQLVEALDLSRINIDKRFTILLPPRIISYLDQVSRKNRVPRAVYIRQLIEEQMRNGCAIDIN